MTRSEQIARWESELNLRRESYGKVAPLSRYAEGRLDGLRSLPDAGWIQAVSDFWRRSFWAERSEREALRRRSNQHRRRAKRLTLIGLFVGVLVGRGSR